MSNSGPQEPLNSAWRKIKAPSFVRPITNSRAALLCLRQSGFTSFQFLLIIVFILSVAGFLAMHYFGAAHDETASPTAAVSTSDATSPPAVTTPHPQSLLATRDRQADQDPGIASFLSRLFNDDETEEEIANIYLPPPMSEAEHAAWAETFHAQLYSPEPVVKSQEEESVPVISGRVMTTHGWPVGGIEVTAQFRNYFKDAESNAIQSAVGTQVTRTNDDGFYVFKGLPAGIYMISTPDSGSYARSRVEVHTGVKYADLVLKQQRYAQVIGVVTDPMGTAIADVRIVPLVQGIPEGDVTNSNGRFGFAVPLQNQARDFPVRFQRQGYREQRYQVSESDWAADGNLSLAVTMEPVYEFSSIFGTVRGADGSQISGETVRLYSSSLKRNYRAEVNDGGEFRFPKVDIADDYQIWVRPTGPYSDYAEQNVELTVGDLWRDIELEPLKRDYRLKGRILDQKGKPVPNMTLTLSSKAASAQKSPLTSNAYGKFEIENVPEGELVFESRTAPYYTVTGVHVSGNDRDHEVDLVVHRGQHKLLGKVVDSDGRPVASPRVFISAAQVISGINTRLSSSTSADGDGRFVFTDLGTGQHTVTVNAPGYEGVRVKPVVGKDSELVIKLEKKSI